MKNTILCLLLLISIISNGQKVFKIYTWGAGGTFSHNSYKPDICEKPLRDKYGFTLELMSSNPSKKQVEKWKKHNENVNKKLRKRNGENWREEMDNEYNNCKLKLSN